MWPLSTILAIIGIIPLVLSRPSLHPPPQQPSHHLLTPKNISNDSQLLVPRQQPPQPGPPPPQLTLSQNIIKGIATIKHYYFHSALLEIRASPPTPSPNRKSPQTFNPVNFKHLTLTFDIANKPPILRHKGAELTLSSAAQWGLWQSQPSYSIPSQPLDEPIGFSNWTLFEQKLTSSFVAALAKFETLHLADPRLSGYRIFARPSQGLLSLALPVDMYYEFILLEPDPARGQPKSIFYGVNSGNLFQDPNSDDSGLVRNESPVPIPATSYFWQDIYAGIGVYDIDHDSAEVLEVVGQGATTATNPLVFTDLSIVLEVDAKQLVRPEVISTDKGLHWIEKTTFFPPATTGMISDTAFNWDEMRGKMDLVAAVNRLKTAAPGIENNIRKWRILARPGSGDLAAVLPAGLYCEFSTKDIMGPPLIRVVYVAVVGGEVYVDPVPGHSGLVRDRSEILPPSAVTGVGNAPIASASAGSGAVGRAGDEGRIDTGSMSKQRGNDEGNESDGDDAWLP